MCSESRIAPGTTTAPIPATWSLIAFSHVTPRPRPKYRGLGSALMVCTGTTNRSPSAEATRAPPHSCATPIEACASTRRALAAEWVSARR
jgi:hypothetical protein